MNDRTIVVASRFTQRRSKPPRSCDGRSLGTIGPPFQDGRGVLGIFEFLRSGGPLQGRGSIRRSHCVTGRQFVLGASNFRTPIAAAACGTYLHGGRHRVHSCGPASFWTPDIGDGQLHCSDCQHLGSGSWPAAAVTTIQDTDGGSHLTETTGAARTRRWYYWLTPSPASWHSSAYLGRCGHLEASLSGLLILAGIPVGHALLATVAYRIASS